MKKQIDKERKLAIIIISALIFSLALSSFPLYAVLTVKAQVDWEPSERIETAVNGVSTHHSGNSFYAYLAYRWGPVWMQNTDNEYGWYETDNHNDDKYIAAIILQSSTMMVIGMLRTTGIMFQ
jgi:hypothetical protein